MPDSQTPCIVWHISDGKPGHDNQVSGLLHALNLRVPVTVHRLHLPKPDLHYRWRMLQSLLRRRCPLGRHLPDPALIVGAGHAAHLPMIAARRARGGRTVVLMKPGLPMRWFDLCIVPAHDNVPPRDNVLVTRGPLNAIRPAPEKLERHGLILLGGPSRHHRWSDRDMLSNIESIACHDPKWRWTIAGSRRTPDSMEKLLIESRMPNVVYVAARDTGPEWLPFRLAEAPRIWVSEDSVSMVYEALSANAAVGLLPVPRLRDDRVTRGVDSLVAEGMVTSYARWREGAALQSPSQTFNEAARCADWIAEQWLNAR